MEKESFQQTVLKQLDIYMQKNVNPYLTPYTKTNSKQTTDLNALSYKVLGRTDGNKSPPNSIRQSLLW